MYKFQYSEFLNNCLKLYNESIQYSYIDNKLNKDRAIIAINLIKVNNDMVNNVSSMMLSNNLPKEEIKRVNFMSEITTDINHYISEIKNLNCKKVELSSLDLWPNIYGLESYGETLKYYHKNYQDESLYNIDLKTILLDNFDISKMVDNYQGKSFLTSHGCIQVIQEKISLLGYLLVNVINNDSIEVDDEETLRKCLENYSNLSIEIKKYYQKGIKTESQAFSVLKEISPKILELNEFVDTNLNISSKKFKDTKLISI